MFGHNKSKAPTTAQSSGRFAGASNYSVVFLWGRMYMVITNVLCAYVGIWFVYFGCIVRDACVVCVHGLCLCPMYLPRDASQDKQVVVLWCVWMMDDAPCHCVHLAMLSCQRRIISHLNGNAISILLDAALNNAVPTVFVTLKQSPTLPLVNSIGQPPRSRLSV